MRQRVPSRQNLYRGKTGPIPLNIVPNRSVPLYYDEPLIDTTQNLQQFSEPNPYQNTSLYYQNPHPEYYQYSTNQQISNQYTSTLEESLYSETYSNIQNIVFENTQMIDHLKRENQRLHKHLDNIKILFQIKLRNRKNQPFKLQQKSPQITNIKTDILKNEIKREIVNQTDFAIDQGQKQAKIKSLKPKTQTFKTQPKLENQTQLQNGSERNLPLPYKGSVNYTDKKWIIEQNFVMGFLHLWMKNNIQYTTDRFCTIEKREILNKYFKWKERQNFPIKNKLQAFKVQQIVTNQIKAMFGCSCTLRQYTGLVYTNELNRSTQEQEVKQEGTDLNDLIQTEQQK